MNPDTGEPDDPQRDTTSLHDQGTSGADARDPELGEKSDEESDAEAPSGEPGKSGRSDEAEPSEDADRGGSAGPRPSDPDGSALPATLSPTTMGGGPPQRPPRRTGVFLDPDDLREHVGGLLRAILGGYEVDGFGNFTFQHEGARAFVTVGPSPIGPQVGIFSVTNLDVDLSPPLASFLLTTNHKLGFGAFSYDEPNRAVWLRHTLLGSTLDLPELQSAVAAVATTAAALDETIRDRFGGRTFSEAPEDVQQHLEPPDASGSHRPPNASGYL